MPKLDDKKAKNAISALAVLALAALGVKYLIERRVDLIFDAASSLAIIGIMHKFHEKLNQDYKSYFLVAFTLILHDLFLYDTMPLGIKFEHYMHFAGGFTIAIFTDRLFRERLPKPKRLLLLVLFALGIGAIAETAEWGGYKILGLGEGFFKYGAGDEGGWDNSILDLIFNGIGASAMAASTLFRKKAKS